MEKLLLHLVKLMMKKYKHIFFDLDHTLWDFERNAEETKREMFVGLDLKSRGIENYVAFRTVYVDINQALWALYREDKIEKEELNFRRFYDTLCVFGIDDKDLGKQMASWFIEGISTKTYLFPYAKEILEYLFPKYQIHIITNGFEEVQYSKLEKSAMYKYFTSVITSEAAECKKPDIEIFKYAFLKTGAVPEESIMIGDDLEVDIDGAKNAGMDQIFVNHEKIKHSNNVTYEVQQLSELQSLL